MLFFFFTKYTPFYVDLQVITVRIDDFDHLHGTSTIDASTISIVQVGAVGKEDD